MISIFPSSFFATKDQSLIYLAQIFGYMNGVIPVPTETGPQTSIATLSLLGTMFKGLNSMVLIIGAFIVLYTTVVGVMMTAHEGEFMGKKWNNIWIPIRTVFGIAALVPTGSGYSAIQIVVMWVIVQGIGLADMIWSTALSYINIAGSPYAQQIILRPSDLKAPLENLFKALTCDATAHITKVDPEKIAFDDATKSKKGGYFCQINSGSPFCRTPTTPLIMKNDPLVPNMYSMGPPSPGAPGGISCGRLSFCMLVAKRCDNLDTNPEADKELGLSCAVCKAQQALLPALIDVMSKIAVNFAKIDYQYREFWANSYKAAGASEWPMVSSYCSSTNVPGAMCCVKAPGSLCKSDKIFPSPNVKSEDNPRRGPSPEAVTDIYWPYGIVPQIGSGNFITTLSTQYVDSILGAITSFINSDFARKKAQGTSPFSQQGWLLASAYYFQLSRTESKSLTNAQPLFEVSIPMADHSTIMSDYRNNFQAASYLINQMAPDSKGGDSGGGGGGGGSSPKFNRPDWGFLGNPLRDVIYDNLDKLLDTTIKPQTANKDNLQIVIGWGVAFIWIGTGIFLALLVAMIVLGQTGSVIAVAIGLGTGGGGSLGAGGITLLALFAGPAILAMIGWIIMLGGTLSVYVPLIPVVIFTFGAIGWFTSVIEALVAAPFVALGILSPSGQHEIMGRAEPALMLLFNIFLRPTLMIFGLMASMILISVVLGFLNIAVWQPLTDWGKGGIMWSGGPISFFIFLSAYVGLIVLAINKACSIIQILPDRVTAWIGGQAGAGETAEAVQEARSGVSTGTSAAKGAADTGAGSLSKRRITTDERADRKTDQEEKAALKAKQKKD